jgi:hypothetical protein
MTVQEPTPPTAAPRRSQYSLGTTSNMLRSLLLMGLFVAILVAIVPRVSEVSRPAVDAVAKARATAVETGWQVELPQGLGEGWRPTVATYEPGTAKVPTLTTVWETPDGGDIALKEAAEPSDAWLARSVNDGELAGSVTIGGRTFERYAARSGAQISYVERGTGASDTTLVATGTASEDELKAFVAALRKVVPAP